MYVFLYTNKETKTNHINPVINFKSEDQLNKLVYDILSLELVLPSFALKRQRHKSVLGSLYKSSSKEFPVTLVNGSYQIDMRLFSQDQGLTKVAEAICEDIAISQSEGKSFHAEIVACSGSGKTSSIFCLGKKHYVVFLDCGAAAMQQDLHLHRKSLGEDGRVLMLFNKIGKEIVEIQEKENNSIKKDTSKSH